MQLGLNRSARLVLLESPVFAPGSFAVHSLHFLYASMHALSTVRHLSALLLSSCLIAPSAAATTYFDDWEKLAQDEQWRKLLHFDARAEVSDVISDGFFLSPAGAVNPLAELLATLAGFRDTNQLDSDQHAQCRYPARLQWLRANRPEIELPRAKCHALERWTNETGAVSLSLIYATGYLGNPASYYGHLLLRINSDTGADQDYLLDTSIDFGAIIPEHDSLPVYIAKGLFGGYESGYTEGVFYEQVRNYGNVELRDMWDYPLQIDSGEVSLIVNHFWELKNSKFKYYYLTENCAYRIVELLQLVTEEPLLDGQKPWVHPVDLIKSLRQRRHRGRALVGESRYVASRQRRFYEKYYRLGAAQRRELRSIVDDRFDLGRDTYRSLTSVERATIVDALFDYVELRLLEDERIELKEAKRSLLQEMLLLSAVTPYRSPENEARSPPELGQNSTALSLEPTRGSQRDLVKLGFRLSYFDLLNLDIGRIPKSQLIMADLKMRFRNDEVEIDYLDFLNIRNYGLPNTGLSGDRRFAWNLRMGWDRPDLSCSDCVVPSIEGGFGWSRKLGERWAGNVSLGGRVAGSTSVYDNVAGSISGELLYTPAPFYRSLFRYSRLRYFGAELNREQWLWQHRFGSATDWDLRLTYRKRQAEEFSVAFSWYF